MSNRDEIAAKIEAGLIKAAEATGSGPYIARITRTVGGSSLPWGGAPGTNLAFDVVVLEAKTKTAYTQDPRGALIPRRVRTLMVSAAGEAPQMGDRIELADGTHEIAAIHPVSPGGGALMFRVEIAA